MKRLLTFLAIFALGGSIFLISSTAFSAPEDNTPDPHTVKDQTVIEIKDPRVISPEDAKALIDQEGSTYTLLDVRTAEEFTAEHIPGAILIPSEELATRAATELPDKSATIIVYCQTGTRSTVATEELAALGYTDIRNLGGLDDWPYDTTQLATSTDETL